MPLVAGRGPEPRTVSGVGTTSASTAITGPPGSFHQRDVGRTISGAGTYTIAGGAGATSPGRLTGLEQRSRA